MKANYLVNILSHTSFVGAMFVFSFLVAMIDGLGSLSILTVIISTSAVFSTFFDSAYFTAKKISDRNDTYLLLISALGLLTIYLIGEVNSNVVILIMALVYGLSISFRSFIHRSYIEFGYKKELAYTSILSFSISSILLYLYYLNQINLLSVLILIAGNNLVPVIFWKIINDSSKEGRFLNFDIKSIAYASSVAFRLNSPVLITFLFSEKNGSDAVASISAAILLCRPLSHFYPMISTVVLVEYKANGFQFQYFLNFIKKMVWAALAYMGVILFFGFFLEKYTNIIITKQIELIAVLLSIQTVFGVIRSITDFRILQLNSPRVLFDIAFISLMLCIVLIFIIGALIGYEYSYIGLLISEIFYVLHTNSKKMRDKR